MDFLKARYGPVTIVICEEAVSYWGRGDVGFGLQHGLCRTLQLRRREKRGWVDEVVCLGLGRGGSIRNGQSRGRLYVVEGNGSAAPEQSCLHNI